MVTLLSRMTDVYDFVISLLTDVISMIVANPLVFLPVLIAIFGGIVMYVISLIRRLGIKGISSSGGRRRGRRR